MKNYYSNKSWSMLTLALFFCLVACQKNNVEQDGIYITLAEANPLVGLSVDELGGTLTITASASSVMEREVEVVFRINPALVENYNTKNGTDFKPLPQQLYKLSAERATIKRGLSVSEAISVLVLPMDNTIEPGTQYMIPVEVVSTSAAGFPLIESSKVLYAQIEQVLVNPALDLSTSDGVNFLIPDPIRNLSAFTVEMRVRVTRGPFVNNMALFSAYPDEIYSRFGDVVIAPDQLQIKYKDVQPASSTRFAISQWYHIAYVFNAASNSFRIYINGQEDVTTTTPPNSTFNLDQMSFGGNGHPIQVQELRFWTVARSAVQLANNMCAVNPQSDGLYGYWKFNEGQGSTVADATGNGHTGTIVRRFGDPIWISAVRCPE